MELSGGRITDFLTATNGSKVSGIVLATYVITNLPGVRQVQFVQTQPGHLDVNIVKGVGYSPQTLVELEQRLRHFLGSEIQLHMHFLAEIPAAPSGKFRFSMSTL
jgi:hypothetical protein